MVQRLGDAGGEVQARHLLVTDLRVQAHELGTLERLDEGEGVTDGRQQDVTAGLVGLGLDSEADVVTLVGHVVTEQVDCLAVALEGGADVFGGVVLGAFTPAPHDEGLGAELGREVEVAQHLAQGEAAHLPVVGGESAVLEDGGREQVGRHHRDDEAGVGQGALEAVDLSLTFGIRRSEGEQVVVVESEAVGAELGELLDGVDDVKRWPGGSTERICPVVADGPEAEGELVGGSGGGHDCSFARGTRIIVASNNLYHDGCLRYPLQ